MTSLTLTQKYISQLLTFFRAITPVEFPPKSSLLYLGRLEIQAQVATLRRQQSFEHLVYKRNLYLSQKCATLLPPHFKPYNTIQNIHYILDLQRNKICRLVGTVENSALIYIS